MTEGGGGYPVILVTKKCIDAIGYAASGKRDFDSVLSLHRHTFPFRRWNEVHILQHGNYVQQPTHVEESIGSR